MTAAFTNGKHVKGRSTKGWTKGEKVTMLSQLKVGNYLIAVSHQFSAVNLIQVTAIVESPATGFTNVYVDVDGKPTWEREMFTWDFELDSKSREHYRAVKTPA